MSANNKTCPNTADAAGFQRTAKGSPSVVSLKYINLWGSLSGKTMRCHPLS